ncbi:hypothetical protein GOP47_0017918 [Adiantum capillus-veneris]|uniref:Uncharacterized protein n=1 Tax=Adiantum capillus-veneris TaxID=13818 RepID=A0A9D4ZBA9_ADICA|nr:hypothetical protein GOP47_0017918 [Adiantum capillus-veneris]
MQDRRRSHDGAAATTIASTSATTPTPEVGANGDELLTVSLQSGSCKCNLSGREKLRGLPTLSCVMSSSFKREYFGKTTPYCSAWRLLLRPGTSAASDVMIMLINIKRKSHISNLGNPSGLEPLALHTTTKHGLRTKTSYMNSWKTVESTVNNSTSTRLSVCITACQNGIFGMACWFGIF